MNKSAIAEKAAREFAEEADAQMKSRGIDYHINRHLLANLWSGLLRRAKPPSLSVIAMQCLAITFDRIFTTAPLGYGGTFRRSTSRTVGPSITTRKTPPFSFTPAVTEFAMRKIQK